jgi:hypothetical protein
LRNQFQQAGSEEFHMGHSHFRTSINRHPRSRCGAANPGSQDWLLPQ